MSKMQRTKGQSGEREIASILSDLTGYDVKRRVRQHDGDSDLVGVPGWSIEVKRHKTATNSTIAGWWKQTVEQSGGNIPVLFYRLDRQAWKAVWPVSVCLQVQTADMWSGYEWTVTGSVEVWAAVARDVCNASLIGGRRTSA